MNNEEKLIKMLKYVSEHNDFYKNRIKEYGITNPLDITQWPILTRKELQNNRHNIFSDGYRTKYLCHQLLSTSSSGTSGTPIVVYWSHRDYYNSMLSLWRRRKAWHGILPTDKSIMFTLSYTNKTIRIGEVLCLETSNRLMFNAASLTSENAYKVVIKYILDFQPKWIYIQPFILEQLIYYYKKIGAKSPSSLMHIESVGEVLNDELRKEAKDFFGVDIVNLYGAEEHGGIAYECTYGTMHVLDENVYVESDALITNINNHAFPLIRYAQGDVISLVEKKLSCACGVNSSCISSIKGRVRNSFCFSGVEVNEYLLSEIIGIVNNQFDGIISMYSFEYSNKTNVLQCKISVSAKNSEWNLIVSEEVKRCLRTRIPLGENLIIKVVDGCCDLRTGKDKILSIIG